VRDLALPNWYQWLPYSRALKDTCDHPYSGAQAEQVTDCIAGLLWFRQPVHTPTKTEQKMWLGNSKAVTLGNGMCEFQAEMCSAFATHELEHEQAAQIRRQEKNMAAAGPANSDPQKCNSGRQTKEFSLKTYKFHSLGDYCNTIRRFGMTDSYSTQSVSLSHTVVELVDINHLSEWTWAPNFKREIPSD